MRKFGLIGKNIDYSFSKSFFSEKFKNENILNASYQNFDVAHSIEIPQIIRNKKMHGFNVTIPYKEAIIPYLDKLNKKAKKIGAVNTIKITKKGNLKGYNTDYYGFKKTLKPHLNHSHTHALILGTGGASKAVAFALKKLCISYTFVSRNAKSKNTISYIDLNHTIIKKNKIIINCTPLGTYPKVNQCPDIPYLAIGKNHILYDLIYNPKQTLFLKKGKMQGAKTINGQKMLELQALKSWEIWNR